MGKLKTLLAASLPILLIAVVAAALLWHSDRQEPDHRPPARSTLGQPPVAPPAQTTPLKSASRPLNHRAAVQEATRCLNALCDTGASDDAVSQTRDLLGRLVAASQPFAARISTILKGVLSYRDGDGSASHTGSVGIPPGLIDRASAACDARGDRRPDEVVLSFAGDCAFGTVNGDDSGARFPSVYRRSGRMDYPFALVRPWFLNDDLSVVNFECTLTNSTKTADKQWHFAGAARYASIFPAGSVEAVGLSNNHSHDYLQAGFDDTIANFRKAHVPAFYQNVPYITTLHGVQTVILGDCTVVGENTTMIDGAPQRILGEIKRYKKPGNIVIVVMHWGSELATVPFPWQQALGRRFVDAGADAVIGHHPHIVQGIECYKGKYIAYSLGNFAFGGNSLARHPETFIFRLRFHVGGGRTSVTNASIVPCAITSGEARNEAGILRNNYQPKPVFGEAAERTVALVLERSVKLKYGLKKINHLNLRRSTRRCA